MNSTIQPTNVTGQTSFKPSEKAAKESVIFVHNCLSKGAGSTNSTSQQSLKPRSQVDVVDVFFGGKRNQVIHQITREDYNTILSGRDGELPARLIERVKAKIAEFGDYVNVPPESWKERSATKGGVL